MRHTYIIGEIGQNHNGSVDLAKLIVDLVSRPVQEETFGLQLKPMDAVKLTKRDLKEELTDSRMNAPYDNPNSFGRTYGEHRAFLELSDEEHFEIYRHAKERGLDFVETLCSRGCLSLLKLFTPEYLKVASRERDFSISIDNQYYKAYNGASFKVTKAEKSIFLVRFQNISFYDTLRNKMMWGIDSRDLVK